MSDNRSPAHLKLALIALFYTIFVIYGSLVPLSYSPVDISSAWQQYSEAYMADWSMKRRSDWFANFLLFIPLTYLWLASFWRSHSSKLNVFSSLALVIFAWLLTSSIEFLQLFWAERVVSINDIVAETLGGITGIILWWLTRGHFFRWLKLLDSKNRWRAYIELYVVLMFAYNLMPLNLSLSPVEIYHKWKQGMILFVPYLQWVGDPFGLTLTFLFDLTLWLALSLLLIKSDKAPSRGAVIFKVTLIATVLEFCQLFVLSRYTDVSDICTAMIAAFIATTLFTKKIIPAKRSEWLLKHASSITIVSWIIVLMLLYWYPYNFSVDKYYIQGKLGGFFGVLFQNYQSGSEFIAITQIIRKSVLAVPIGLALGWHSRYYKKLNPTLLLSYSLLICTIFFSVELGQVLIKGKVVHQTDAWLGFFGSLVALFGMRHILIEKYYPSEPLSGTTRAIKQPKLTNHLPSFIPPVGLFVCLIVVAGLPQTPYNLKELLQGSNTLIQTALITLFLFFFLGSPYRITQSICSKGKQHRLFIKQLIMAFFLHMALSAILLRIIAPVESLHDVVGSPTWGSLRELEYFYRSSGLLSLFSGALFFVSISLIEKEPPSNTRLPASRFLYQAFYLCLVIPLSYIVVITDAGTDNIAELLRNNGYSFNLLAIPLYLLLIFYLGLTLRYRARTFNTNRALLFTGLLVASFPIGYYALHFATEPFIIKYGKVFSALQFLLSTNRENYINSDLLIVRLFIFQTGLILMITLLQPPLLKKVLQLDPKRQ